MRQRSAQPATEPRAAISTNTQTVRGLPRAALITRKSLISGIVRKDESTRATRKRPTGPSVGRSTACTHSTSRDMRVA
jgi:hypothetical protein